MLSTWYSTAESLYGPLTTASSSSISGNFFPSNACFGSISNVPQSCSARQLGRSPFHLNEIVRWNLRPDGDVYSGPDTTGRSKLRRMDWYGPAWFAGINIWSYVQSTSSADTGSPSDHFARPSISNVNVNLSSDTAQRRASPGARSYVAPSKHSSVSYIRSNVIIVYVLLST